MSAHRRHAGPEERDDETRPLLRADRASLRWLAFHLLREWRLALAGLAVLPLSAAFGLAQPLLLKVGLDEHIVPGRLEGLGALALLFALSVGGQVAASFAETYFLQLLGGRIGHAIREEIFAHLQRLSASFYDRNPVGRLMTRLTGDVEAIQELFSSGVISALADLFTLAGIVALMLYLDARLALVSFAVLPLLAALILFYQSPVRDAFREVRARLARLNGALQEDVSGMEVVQAHLAEGERFGSFEAINRSHREACLRAIRYDAILFSAVEAGGSVAVALVLWQGAGGVAGGTLTLGALAAFIEYIAKFFAPLKDLSAKYTLVQSALASSERILELLRTEPEILPPRRPRALPRGEGHVAFEGVSFAYAAPPPGRDGGRISALSKVSFEARPGEVIALVGATGAGKTTALKLLCRFYDAQEGRILLDGSDIRELDPRELRSAVSLVMQEPFLFAGDVARNISLGDGVPPEEELERAARLVGAEELIRKLPGGYRAPVGERGGNLSQGERQLIAFARAAARGPRVLALDEATANVDPIAEARVQRALARLLGRTTTLVVAHRLSTIRRADRIVVLHKGEVREEGTHAELLARRGIYEMLWRLQGGGPPPRRWTASRAGRGGSGAG